MAKEPSKIDETEIDGNLANGRFSISDINSFLEEIKHNIVANKYTTNTEK